MVCPPASRHHKKETVIARRHISQNLSRMVLKMAKQKELVVRFHMPNGWEEGKKMNYTFHVDVSKYISLADESPKADDLTENEERAV